MSEQEFTPQTPADPAAELEALRLKVVDLNAKAAENWDKFLRASAELDNVRRRAEREANNAQKYGLEKILNDLLAVADSLDLGLKAAEGQGANVKTLAEGLKLTHRQLTTVLEKNGVSVEDPKGRPFDADRHHAVSMAASTEVPPNHVLSVMQKGYVLFDRVLRPAMVVVAQAPAVDLNQAPSSPNSSQG